MKHKNKLLSRQLFNVQIFKFLIFKFIQIIIFEKIWDVKGL